MYQDEKTPIKAGDVRSGDDVAIFLGFATAPTAISVEHLFGVVAAATPKAIRLRLDAVRGATRNLWLPRRALVHVSRDRIGVHARLARWWRPDDTQAIVLDACRHLGSLDVAS